MPLSATSWTNQYAQRVIMIAASHPEPLFQTCDHGRSSVLGRRPFRGPLRTPAAPATHRHYTELLGNSRRFHPYAGPALPGGELRRRRSCRELQMVNVGTAGARESSPWFEAPGGNFVTCGSRHDAALAGGQRGCG